MPADAGDDSPERHASGYSGAAPRLAIVPVTSRTSVPCSVCAIVGVAGALTLSACTAPDVFVESPRPNSPTASASASVNPQTDPAKLQTAAEHAAGVDGAHGARRRQVQPSVRSGRHRHLGAVQRRQPADRELHPGRPGGVRRPGHLHQDSRRAHLPRQQLPQRARLRHRRHQQQEAGDRLDPRHRRREGRGLLLGRRRLDRPAADGELAEGDQGGDGARPRAGRRRLLRRGDLPGGRRQGLPDEPGRREGHQAPDRHRLRLQGHRLDRSARLPAALRRDGPRPERRQDRRLALPDLRPDPEQGGQRLERHRSGVRAAATGAPSTPPRWSTRPPTP